MLDGIHFDTQDRRKNVMQELGRKGYQVVKTDFNIQVYPILKEMIALQRFTPGSRINVS